MPVKSKAKLKSKPATKKDQVLALLKRPKGVTITELSKATNWQPHSVRGFLSGTAKKLMGLEVFSEKDDTGVRRYRVSTGEEG